METVGASGNTLAETSVLVPGLGRAELPPPDKLSCLMWPLHHVRAFVNAVISFADALRKCTFVKNTTMPAHANVVDQLPRPLSGSAKTSGTGLTLPENKTNLAGSPSLTSEC